AVQSLNHLPRRGQRLPSNPLLDLRLPPTCVLERSGSETADPETRGALEPIPPPGHAAAQDERLVLAPFERRAHGIRRLQVLREAAPSLNRETLMRATLHGAPECPRSRSSSPR